MSTHHNPAHTETHHTAADIPVAHDSVHCRFYLAQDARASYWHSGGKSDAAKVQLAAVPGEPFGPATPQGSIEMLIVNPDAIKFFRNASLGTEFDILITPVHKSHEAH